MRCLDHHQGSIREVPISAAWIFEDALKQKRAMCPPASNPILCDITGENCHSRATLPEQWKPSDPSNTTRLPRPLLDCRAIAVSATQLGEDEGSRNPATVIRPA
jgi:hypothetical protein